LDFHRQRRRDQSRRAARSGCEVWPDHWRASAEAEKTVSLQEGARLRHVRVVRDYGMFDRREAPQYYADAKGAQTLHS
jgi:hypothetical protein